MRTNNKLVLGISGAAVVVLLLVAGITGGSTGGVGSMMNGGRVGGGIGGIGSMMGGGMMGGGVGGLLVMMLFWALVVALFAAVLTWVLNQP